MSVMGVEDYKKKYQTSLLSWDDNKCSVVPTCSRVLNNMLGGGFISGRLVEIYGHEGSGKSTLMLSTVSMLAKAASTEFFVIIDTEGAICSLEYVKKLGLDANNVLIINQSDGDEVFDMVEDFITDSKCCMVVVDSIASLATKDDISHDDSLGAHARMISRRLRGLMSKISRTSSKACIVFINQLRSKIGDLWKGEMNYTTTGGKSIRYYACLRLEIERDSFVNKGDSRVGFYSKVKVIKSRYSVPYAYCLLPFIYGRGFSFAMETIDVLMNSGYVRKSGPWFVLEYNGQKICSKSKLDLWESVIADSNVMKIIDDNLGDT